MRRAAIVFALAAAACGDNYEPPRVDCSALVPPATGLDLAAAREAHRRAAQRQQLRYRDAIEPGYVMRVTSTIADQTAIDRGQVCPQDLAEVGRILFEHRFTFADGLAAGEGPAPFHRVQAGRAGGPETTTCTSCHWRNGQGGGGGVADDAFLLGDGDRVTTGDARNPPALQGAGIVQALAEEMSVELAAERDDAIAKAKREGGKVTVELTTKGVSFGTIQVDGAGRVDTDGLRGIDPDLVVKPFGWKGTNATISEFIAEAAALHLGMQSDTVEASDVPDPVELGAGPVGDRDGDGVVDELTSGQITALAVYVASLDMPVMQPFERPLDLADPAGPTEPFLVEEWSRGRAVFGEVGCPTCHVPRMPLASSKVTIRSQASGGAGVTVDLATQTEAPRLAYDAASGEFPAFVFSDLKRHNLGEDNASTHLQNGIATRLYLTRPLWGVGDSAPYFYDGGSATIEAAIERHGGDAAFARDNWRALSASDRSALRVFLYALRRAPRLVVP